MQPGENADIEYDKVVDMSRRSLGPRPVKLTRFEFAAFISGFSLLAYELAAARILAPSIGSSTYVWTSVIGVIIAALSTGYAAGGVLADKRDRRSDIAWLLLLAALGVAYTLTFSDSLLFFSTHLTDPRLQGLLVATILFSPASFLLGVISPYLAKLRVMSLETTGKSVAMLSAANALGGIVGTFSVGFIFFGYIGSKETLVFTALLLITASLLFAPIELILRRVMLSVILFFSVTLAVFAVFPPGHVQGQVADIDTPSARYIIANVTKPGLTARLLITGPNAAQSGLNPAHPGELVFFYPRQMADLVEQTQSRQHILILGGGGLILPQYLAKHYPASQIDVVEIDPQLTRIARQYFQYRDPINIHIYNEDARVYLNHNQVKYDIVLVDVFNDLSIPFSLTTEEYTGRLKASLAPEGLVVVNFIGSDRPACRPLLRAVHGSYASRFAHYQLYPQFDRQLISEQNIVIAYSDRALHDPKALSYKLSDGQHLTDNYAPTERLKLQCQTSRV